MYTLVAYINDYDSMDGPYIYQFDTKEEADKAESELLSCNFSVERQISKYVPPTRYYGLSSIASSGSTNTEIELKIEEYYTYGTFQESMPVLLTTNMVYFPNYYGYSQDKEKLEEFKKLADKQIKEYKLVNFKSGNCNGGNWYVNQAVPRFIVELSGCKWWSDGEFISKCEVEKQQNIIVNLRPSGLSLSGTSMIPLYYNAPTKLTEVPFKWLT